MEVEEEYIMSPSCLATMVQERDGFELARYRHGWEMYGGLARAPDWPLAWSSRYDFKAKYL